jgi:polar amino acid transport system substrate-binding protein
MSLAVDADLLAELAPLRELRVALNLSNFLLVGRDPTSGAHVGVAPDLGKEIAARLGVPCALQAYANAGAIADAADAPVAQAWDIAFIGAEREREHLIAFSPAYVEIEATYLVPGGSPIRRLDDVDRPGVRVVTAARSAYDLHLARTLRHAEIVAAPGIPASFDAFVAGGYEVLAGLKPRLLAEQRRLPGARILEGRFTAIRQAIGTPRRRVRAAQWLAAYVADAKASGAVAAAITRHRIEGLSVAAG